MYQTTEFDVKMGKGGYGISTVSLPNDAIGIRHQQVMRAAIEGDSIYLYPLVSKQQDAPRGAQLKLQTMDWLRQCAEEPIESGLLAELAATLVGEATRWKCYSVRLFPGHATLWFINRLARDKKVKTPQISIRVNLAKAPQGSQLQIYRVRKDGRKSDPYEVSYDPVTKKTEISVVVDKNKQDISLRENGNGIMMHFVSCACGA